MLNVVDASHAYGEHAVLHGVNLSVEREEIMCVLGPSGCGKTTLLRLIAGLEPANGGDVLIEGQSVRAIPVHQREFGLMFQDFALFPHMDVVHNVAFGLKMRNVSGRTKLQRAREMLELVGLSGYEERDVSQLSGGERQRVALARSLAPEPRLLMLDEPLGSLDAALRGRLVVELRDILKRLGMTTLYVTHDQHEAYAIADRIAVMNAGRVEQVGAPRALYHRPATAFVARFLGLVNVAPVTSRRERRVSTELGDFEVAGSPDAILLHPDGIQLASPDEADAISGTISQRIFQGSAYRFMMQPDDAAIPLMFTLPSNVDRVPAVGDQVAVRCRPDMLLPLNNEQGSSPGDP